MQQSEGNVYVVEQVELSSQSDDLEELEHPESLDLFNDSLNDINELDKLMNSTLKHSHVVQTVQSGPAVPKHVFRLEVVDDFIRNFLIRNNMTRTLEAFQREWYEYVQNIKNQGEQVPDAHLEKQVLKDQIEQVSLKLTKAIQLSDNAKSNYDRLLKERDFHKMHHHRVQQDKKKLNENKERLLTLESQLKKRIQQLQEKYNFAMKQKMLIKIERDRLKAETQVKKDQSLPALTQKDTALTSTSKIKWTPFPNEETLANPNSNKNLEVFNYKQTILSRTHKAHVAPVCSVTIHPKKPIVGTGGQDGCWKLWTINQSELIMTGEGHKDWVSSLKFHPRGLHIATASGDGSIKIWDFANNVCTFTFNKEHRQPVWSVDFNRTGDYVASGSMDHSSRLFDVNIGKCRSVYRGHVDSVNCVSFEPFGNCLASASSDKTVSIWDIRSSLCVQTFYGHPNCVNGVRFNQKADRLFSCDANGILKSWDIRAGKEAHTFTTEGSKNANCVSVDRSGSIVAVGCDGGVIYLFNDSNGEKEGALRGHEQKSRVNSVEFDINSKMIVSGGSDGTYRIWQ